MIHLYKILENKAIYRRENQSVIFRILVEITKGEKKTFSELYSLPTVRVIYIISKIIKLYTLNMYNLLYVI